MKNLKVRHLLVSLLVIFSFASIFAMCDDDIDVDPEQDKRDNIAPLTWHCQLTYESDEGDEDDPFNYDVEIKKDPNVENKIIMLKFFDDETATATITGFDITLPSQVLNGYTIVGTGTIQDDYQRIDWQFTADDDVITATFTPGSVTKTGRE